MTAPDICTDLAPSSADPKPLGAPRSQTSFDRSAQVPPSSSRAWDENTFSPVLEVSRDDVFAPSPSAPHATSTTATTPSTTDTAPSEPGHEGPQGQKRVPSSDTLYSQAHWTSTAGPSNYPKQPTRPRLPSSSDEEDAPPPQLRRRRSSGTDCSREHQADAADRHRYPKCQLRNRLLAIVGRGSVLSILTLFTFISLLSTCPSATADRFALRNSYSTVENRYHLMAYDCSDPTEVQAYSSIPARPCSIRTTRVQQERQTRFQLLQKKQKMVHHSLFLFPF